MIWNLVNQLLKKYQLLFNKAKIKKAGNFPLFLF